jgi:hypothetical protein
MVSHLKAQPNITLFSGFQGSGAYVWSPFVIKLEARLRFTGLSYRTEAGSLLKAPRGKIPYIAISRKDSDGQAPVTPMILGDSTLAVGLRIGQNMNTLWNNPIQVSIAYFNNCRKIRKGGRVG